MTDKEKIRAEVKRRKDELHYLPFTDENLGKINAYEFVLKIIDSLSEEPASKDLEEAAEKAATLHSHISGDKFIPNDYWLFKKGANWQKKQTINKACEWLERNAPFGVVSHDRIWDMIQGFRKAMEN